MKSKVSAIFSSCKPTGLKFFNTVQKNRAAAFVACNSKCFCRHIQYAHPNELRLFLTVNFVRNRQLFTAMTATRSQNTATIRRLHTLTESVLILSLAVVGLKCTFHNFLSFYSYFVCWFKIPIRKKGFRTAKLDKDFLTTKLFLLIFHYLIISEPIFLYPLPDCLT